MQKIYVFFFLGLVILLGGLNFGLYKYKEEDKQDFYQQLCDQFVSSESYRGIGYLTKDFDPSTGKWSLDWIKTESFVFGDEQKNGIIIQTVQLEPSILKCVDGKKIHIWLMNLLLVHQLHPTPLLCFTNGLIQQIHLILKAY